MFKSPERIEGGRLSLPPPQPALGRVPRGWGCVFSSLGAGGRCGNPRRAPGRPREARAAAAWPGFCCPPVALLVAARSGSASHQEVAVGPLVYLFTRGAVTRISACSAAMGRRAPGNPHEGPHGVDEAGRGMGSDDGHLGQRAEERGSGDTIAPRPSLGRRWQPHHVTEEHAEGQKPQASSPTGRWEPTWGPGWRGAGPSRAPRGHELHLGAPGRAGEVGRGLSAPACLSVGAAPLQPRWLQAARPAWRESAPSQEKRETQI